MPQSLSPITLPGAPTANNHAVTKSYVDTRTQGVYTGSIPAGTTTPTITHNLGSTNISVVVRDSTGVEKVTANQATNENNVQLTFSVAPTAGQYTIRIEGGTPATTIYYAPITLADAATIVTDASLGTTFRVTLGGNRTLANPIRMMDGQKIMWEITQDATGGRTLTLGSAFALGTDLTAVTLSTAANKTDYLGTIYNAFADKHRVIAFAKGY